MKEITKENLKVKIFENRSLMGAAAAEAVSEKISELLLPGFVSREPCINIAINNLLSHLSNVS